MEEMLKRRTTNVYDLCDKYSKEISGHQMNSHKRLAKKYLKTKTVIMDYKRGVSFCTIAKTGK